MSLSIRKSESGLVLDESHVVPPDNLGDDTCDARSHVWRDIILKFGMAKLGLNSKNGCEMTSFINTFWANFITTFNKGVKCQWIVTQNV